MKILAIRTDKPEAELYIYNLKDLVADVPNSREEQPEQKSHFLPGAMRNPEGVSYRPKATIKWEAHRQLAETIHKQVEKILNPSTKVSKLRNPITDYPARDLARGRQVYPLDDIDGIVVFEGPGSFTGLRVGLSVANALAYAQGIPIVAGGGDNWLKDGINDLLTGKNDKIAAPEYGAPPKTTSPKK